MESSFALSNSEVIQALVPPTALSPEMRDVPRESPQAVRPARGSGSRSAAASRAAARGRGATTTRAGGGSGAMARGPPVALRRPSAPAAHQHEVGVLQRRRHRREPGRRRARPARRRARGSAPPPGSPGSRSAPRCSSSSSGGGHRPLEDRPLDRARGPRAGVVCDHEPPAPDHGEARAEHRHVLHDVRGEEHDPVAGQLGEEPVEAEPLLGIEAGGRLVHDDEPRVARRSPGRCRAAGASRPSTPSPCAWPRR